MKEISTLIIVIFLSSLIFISSARAMCTEQYFPNQNSKDPKIVVTDIYDTKSNYDTHEQWRNHRQCWNSKSLIKPIILVTVFYIGPKNQATTSIKTQFTVSSHGVIKAIIKNIMRERHLHWELEIINIDDNNNTTHIETYQCYEEFNGVYGNVKCY